MSVIKSLRGESSVEFINTARELNMFTLRQCMNLPKRYTFFIGQHIAGLANTMYNDVILANTIKPESETERQKRRTLFQEALGLCEAIVTQVSIVREMTPIGDHALMEWMRLIDEEERLLRGVMKKDKARDKDTLPR